MKNEMKVDSVQSLIKGGFELRPVKQIKVKLIKGIRMKGQGAVKAGTVLEVDETFARELMANGQAIEATEKKVAGK